ncbi:MAG: HAD family hydrolase, partial [Anaerolineae bacterium]
MPIRVVFFDLGDTLVEIAPDVVRDSARQITALTGYPISATELKQAEQAEWLVRPPRDFLWVKTEEQERKFWEDDFYPSVLRRLGIASCPPHLAQLLAARAMDPRSFVLFPEVKEVLGALRRAGV